MVWKRLHERVGRMVQGVIKDEDETFLFRLMGQVRLLVLFGSLI